MNITSSYTFETISEDQFEELFTIYQKLFPPFGWSEKYLRWQYYKNPCGAAKVWVARESGKIVASYAAIPHFVYANGQVATGWRVQNVVTLPEHRGQGLYHSLATIAAQELFKEDHPLNFAFPNERSKKGFIRTGWKAPFRLPLRIKSIRQSPPCANSYADVKPLIRFDTDSDTIWGAHRNGSDFAIERSSSYMNWRYFDNPKSEYFSFRLDSGKALAILILKFFARDDGKHISHLCDLFQSEPDSALTESAFKHWIDFSVGRDCWEMSCWSTTRNSITPVLNKAGFSEKDGFDRWMVLNANTSTLKKATTSRYDQEIYWHLGMGDSDVY